ncbi:MAG: hypothetical protein PHC28_07810, partial [Flavobacterium sp.]|uniref:hypothetical protein n=1 Tax=Flavobacterium sp. TaxID=239 RepID=UPI00262BE390
KEYNNKWIYNDIVLETITTEQYGFLYEISNGDKKYVGKKLFWNKAGTEESNWKFFYPTAIDKSEYLNYNRKIISIHDKSSYENTRAELYVNKWQYQGNDFNIEDIPKNIESFVYIIEDTLNDKWYIGKKTFFFRRKKIVNGRNKNIKLVSDWQFYYGSNEFLHAAMKDKDCTLFKRTILYLCESKAEASYLELREQIDHRCLEKENYYNHWIDVKVTKSHLNKFNNRNKNEELFSFN